MIGQKWKKENKDNSYRLQKLKIDLISRFLKRDDKILDFGCGTGLLPLEVSKHLILE